MYREYNITAKEESIACHGLDFLCLYGKHINGGFVAIINWGVATELSADYELAYNHEKILEALKRSPDVAWLPSDVDARSMIARELAMVISERIMKMSE